MTENSELKIDSSSTRSTENVSENVNEHGSAGEAPTESPGSPESVATVHSDEKDFKDLEKAEEDELIYDRGYCWIVCLSAAILNANTWGMNSGFAIYFSTYINNDTFPGASKLDYAAVGGIAFGTALMFTPFINYLQGRIGDKGTIIIGNCCQFTALMLASFCKKLWQLYLTQGLLQSCGLALISVPAVAIVPQFFKKRRVLASGLAAAGSGVGGIVYNLGMQKIVQVKSVFWALRAQAIMSFGLVWIAVLLFRTRSKQHKIEFTLFDSLVFKNRGYHLALGYVTTCMFGYVVTLYTIANHTTSLGYSSYQGSIAAAMIQLGSLVGRPLVGHFSDKIGPMSMAAYCYLLSAIFCAAMSIPARNYATIIAYALIMGAIMGTIFGTIAPLLARLVGIAKMNIALGMLWSLLGVASIVSPVIGVALVKSGSPSDPTRYTNCSIFGAVAFFVCSTCLFLLRGFVLGRDEIIASEGKEDIELDSLELVSIKVPVAVMAKHLLRFTNVKV